MTPGQKWFAGFLAIALCYIALTGICITLTRSSDPVETLENQEWVASGDSWIDRQACRWFGSCGALHLNREAWTWNVDDDGEHPSLPDFSKFWESGDQDPDSWSDDEKALRTIPQYVYDYAPYVHLFSEEQFWPCDLAEHLVHLSAYKNYTKLIDYDRDLNLTNLNKLNDVAGKEDSRFVFLHSKDNVEERPEWLGGVDNIPNSPRIGNDEEDEEPWSGPDDMEGFPADPTRQQLYVDHKQDTESIYSTDWDTDRYLQPSDNGRCGGNSGFTCKGSKFGKCCSIYGWCGKGGAYCGQACDSMAGECRDPSEPVPKPHPDLRKRRTATKNKKRKPRPAHRSSAPAVLIVVPKSDGIVDAFWFFFYSFNQGQRVFNIRFGNHVGDWEHTLVRFKDGKPIAAALSEHDFGAAWGWDALEKYLPNPDESGTMIGSWSNSTAAKLAKRPVVYSAVGTHAMYPTPGLQPYILPWGILHDQTDRGPLWDPSLNLHSYTWDHSSRTFRASTDNPKSPTNWLEFAGHWGDKVYPLSDSRQYRFAGQYHYVNGPKGPRYKHLARKEICQRPRKGVSCVVRHLES